MSRLILVLLFLSAITCYGQRAKYANDTLTYKDLKFITGDTVNVAYGSGENGKFVFIFSGSAMTGTEPLSANNSKLTTRIEKIYKSSGRLLIRCKVLEGMVKNPLGGNKIFIEPEGAIDKKEID